MSGNIAGDAAYKEYKQHAIPSSSQAARCASGPALVFSLHCVLSVNLATFVLFKRVFFMAVSDGWCAFGIYFTSLRSQALSSGFIAVMGLTLGSAICVWLMACLKTFLHWYCRHLSILPATVQRWIQSQAIIYYALIPTFCCRSHGMSFMCGVGDFVFDHSISKLST